jgi:hypothetical protein
VSWKHAWPGPGSAKARVPPWATAMSRASDNPSPTPGTRRRSGAGNDTAVVHGEHNAVLADAGDDFLVVLNRGGKPSYSSAAIKAIEGKYARSVTCSG